jgi:hypothetical protein
MSQDATTKSKNKGLEPKTQPVEVRETCNNTSLIEEVGGEEKPKYNPRAHERRVKT